MILSDGGISREREIKGITKKDGYQCRIHTKDGGAIV